MTIYSYTVQTSHDRGATWNTGPVIVADPEEVRAGAQELAADTLDATYRTYLDGDGRDPVPLIQVFVWDRPTPAGPPTATSATGIDHQWSVTGELLAEIAADIRHLEDEKKAAEAKAAEAQRAIGNAKARLENVTRSALAMKMPQVEIAHRTGRSREWVRRLQ